jgi:hypothetical protein
LKAAPGPGYDAVMTRVVRARSRAGAAVVVLGAALASLAIGAMSGCNAGGLLVVEGSTSGGQDAGPVVLGPSVTDLVNGGNVASNAKYKVVYTLGQPTPNQNVEKSAGDRLNGGLVGAMNGQ